MSLRKIAILLATCFLTLTACASDTSSKTSNPIEQVQIILGGTHSYESIDRVTDSALDAANLPLSDENRSRAWSSALAVTEDSDVSPMAVMQCASGLLSIGSGISLPEAIALCYVELDM